MNSKESGDELTPSSTSKYRGLRKIWIGDEGHKRKEEWYWLVSAILLLVSGAGATAAAMFTLGQLNQTRKDQRAWIPSPQIHAEMVADGSYNFKLRFSNVGRTPTQGLYISARIVSGSNDWAQKQRNTCDAEKSSAAQNVGFEAYAIIPGEPFFLNGCRKHQPGKSLLRECAFDKPDYLGIKVSYLQSIIDAQIAGCISYKSRDDDGETHETMFYAPIEFDKETVSVPFTYSLGPD